LQEGWSVQLEGVLTYFDERSSQLVLQDETGGIAIERRAPTEGLALGDRVTVSGFTAWEAFAPVIVNPRIQRMGKAALPPALKADPVRLFKGDLDYQRVEVECEMTGVITAAFTSFELQLRMAGREFKATCTFTSRIPIHRLAKARIRLKGVPVTSYTPAGEVHSLLLLACDPRDLELVTPPAEEKLSPRSGTLPYALTRVRDIKAMSNDEAQKGYPFRVQGTVTYFDPGLDKLFIEDATGGIYVRPPEKPAPGLAFGCLLDVEGKTASGAFAPMLAPDVYRVLGPGPMPKPLLVHASEGFSALNENRWSMIEGIVRKVRSGQSGEARLYLADGPVEFLVTVLDPPIPAETEALIDTRVRIQGVYAPIFSADKRLLGFHISTPSLKWLEVLDSRRGDGFESPARPIHSLLEYSPEGFPVHRVKVEGRITHLGSDGLVYLADASGGIRLEGLVTEGLHVGDPVQAIGFLSWNRSSAALKDVVLHPSRELPEVLPVPVAADATMTGLLDGRLIQVEGFLSEQSRAFGDRILSLESGRTRFTAVLESPQPFPESNRLRDGALVKLTGVCEIGWNENTTPPLADSMRIRLRTPSDIQILKEAPWWTLGRVLIVLAGLAALLLGIAFWMVLLQRKLKAQTQQLHAQMKQREMLEEQLRQAQKLEGIGRLAGGVAHDFNNLLTVINGYCEMLTMELKEGSDLAACAQEIRKATERASGLTRQLLAFSRKQILQPVVLDLNVLVQEMNLMLRRLVTEDIELITRPSPEPCPIKVDPGQISQVLMNLVVNAKDAMPEGGKIILETSRITLDDDYLKLRPDVAPGPYVQLSVTDTGHGMDPETLKQIFEPFFTTKGLGKGTGLGLSTVFGIVKQSGGHIWTYSEPEHGTTFKLFFPRVDETPVQPQPGVAMRSKGGGETVLVVEDQPEVLRTVCKALDGSAYQILTALTVEQALEIAHGHTGIIHLLLTDVVMPGMNGKDLASRIQQMRPGIRVMYMSGYTENAVVNQGILEPGIAFIQKPFSPRELVNRVVETLRANR
jgi:signal transduction histidine kinase/ActR/RegA family two-component response regulator